MTTVEEPKATTVIDEVIIEQMRHEQTWGKNYYDDYSWMTILMEELGKACSALMTGDFEEYRKRLVRLAAKAVGAVTEYDHEFVEGEEDE